ncbi:GIY-YIG nuclease family protein [Limnoglobus roseus]|uniref:Bacteriophage T5 Orf172 DNA-binding domain-containing protein n=1 Tax=Limnoglobus roseus TaxID=2598579 RepID=A0A5C1ALL0_9BACT|nr:GIY-YIG nuclease family protein [Limnoglobus roseus]QEL18856.1 hypothetical protein PX52LOC_05897 [Limnoglobus roseus]
MSTILLVLFGFALGMAIIFFPMMDRQKRIDERERKADRRAEDLDADERQLDGEERRLREEREAFAEEVRRDRASLAEQARALQLAQADFQRRSVSYDEHVRENQILKADIRNTATSVARQKFEQQQLRDSQARVESLANQVAHRYLSETQTWVSRSLTETNYVTNKKRLQDAITRCRAMGVIVTTAQEAEYMARLQAEYEDAVRVAFEKEAQAQARQRFREDQQRVREQQQAEAEREKAEVEKRAVEARLAKAMEEALGKQSDVMKQQHADDIARIQKQLAEAQQKLDERTEKAISLAQLTKVGNVYVISNIGSFGEGVFKIGMTRRAEPMERVIELGDASVPFPFDVHMMIRTDNAPDLEHKLHQRFRRSQVNKVNPRKEFFRLSLDDVVKAVQELHGEVVYTVTPDATQYRESLSIRPEDQEVIERVHERERRRMPATAFEEE